MPRKTKFKKQHKGSKANKINREFSLYELNQNQITLKSLAFGRITEKQIETCRMTINKNLKKFGRLIINIQADTPVTKKPTEIRMGKGKGTVDRWVCKVKTGTPLFTIQYSSKTIALNALEAARIKLPISSKIITHE
jgi:large subunit ribosomal protein L16